MAPCPENCTTARSSRLVIADRRVASPRRRVPRAALSASPALAQDTCQSKAIGKDGKALHGAALNSFMTKCARDVCEPKAIDKNGKPLAGAAKTSFLKKCQAEA